MLLQSHDLESVEVGERSSSLSLVLSLGPFALLPLGVNLRLLPCGLQGSRSDGTGQLLDRQVGQQDVGQRDSLSGNDQLGVCRGSINQSLENSQSIKSIQFNSRFILPISDLTYALVVDDLDNGSESASEGTCALDEDDAADLDLAPLGGFDRCVAHCDGILIKDRR